MNQSLDPRAKLSWREKISYSAGEMGTNLLFAAMSAYLLVYYTNYAHIDPGMVATIMFVSKFIDAVSDLAMGHIMERFAKPGAKARPWIRRMLIPYAISAFILFTVPELNSTFTQGLYVFLTYNLFCTIYTMMVIPYTSLQALITQDDKDREMTGVLRSVFNTVASTIVNSFTMTFIGMAGDTKGSWSIVIGAYALISVVVYAICYFNTKERVVDSNLVSEEDAEKKKLSFKEGLNFIFRNKYWRILTLNSICAAAVISLNMGTMYYFLAYVCGKPQSVPIVGMLLSMPMLVLIPLSKPIVAKVGLRNGLAGGLTLMTVGRLLVGIFGSASFAAIYIGTVLFAIGCSTQWCAYPMLCSTVEYGEWKFGHRQEGMIMSANSFGSKFGAAIGTALCGWVLAWTGYDGAAEVQTALALRGISIVYVVLPIVLNIICIVVLSLFKLEKEYPTIVKELEERSRGVQE